ncbi:MAG: hypothetical protein H6510_12970 [Acidobacteria bacterium]|nr:hypothetical protein [Acidobacteriota bacterium]MCB9398718.1 hypothetical protein [Acidobacteriota bacterium]
MLNQLCFVLVLGFQVDAEGVIPHLTRVAGGFSTFLHIQNASDLEKVLYLRPFSEAGEPLGTVAVALKPGETLVEKAEDLVPKQASHLFISGSQRVRIASSIEASVSAETVSSQEAIWSLNNHYTLLPIVKAESDLLWQGLALVNVNDWSIDISVARETDQGTDTITLSLGPRAKQTALFRDLFGDGQTATRFHCDSADRFAVVALGGTMDKRYLWLTAGIPEPIFASAESTNQTFPEVQKDPYEIRAATVQEELLRLDVTYPVTCRYQSRLYYRPEFLESNPVQINVTMVQEILPNGACLRAFQDAQETFDLSPIAELYQSQYGNTGDILINIYDNQNQKVDQLLFSPFAFGP